MRHIDHFTAFLKRPPTIALMAVYLVVMFWQQHHGQTLTKDSLEYLNAGKNILHSATLYAGDLNDLPDYRLYSKRPPLYPLILISTFFNQWVLFIVQILAGVFALFLGTEIGRILQSKPLSDRQFNLYMLLALLFPAQWIYGSVVMSDLLLQLFLTSAVYFLLIISRENKSVAYWGFALSLSAGMLLKPVMAPIALLSPLLLVLRTVRSGGLKKILLMIPVLVFLGFSFRNHTMSGQFEYSSISHINLLQYNTRYLLNLLMGSK